MPPDDAGASRRARGAFPPTRKSLGQHFLTDRRILGRIADALQLKLGLLAEDSIVVLVHNDQSRIVILLMKQSQ